MFSFKRGFFLLLLTASYAQAASKEEIMKNEFDNFLGTQKHQLEVKDFLRSLVFLWFRIP